MSPSDCRQSSSFEKNSIQTTHIGWIPNTAGHVYFRHAFIRKPRGLDCYVARPPYIKEETDEGCIDKRYILATSLDDLNDYKPGDNSAKFTRYIVQAESKNRGQLCGELWMIWNPRGNPTESLFERTIVTLFDRLNDQSEALSTRWVNTGESIDAGKLDKREIDDELILEALKEFRASQKEISELLENIRINKGKYKYCPDESDYWVSKFRFAVSNTGFCYLEPDDPESTNAEIEIENAYYYLKYLLHKHQHHDAQLDALCRIHEIKKNTNNHGDECIGLSIDLLRDIKSTLIEMKLNQPGKDSATRGAHGIASYAISLIQQLKAEGILKIDNPEHMDFIARETIYINSLISSKNTLQQDADSSSKLKILYRMNLVFVFLTLLFGPVILFGIEIAKIDIFPPSDPNRQAIIIAPLPIGVSQSMTANIAFSPVDQTMCKQKSFCNDINSMGDLIKWIICYQNISGLMYFHFSLLFFSLVFAYYSLYITGKSVLNLGTTLLIENMNKFLTLYPLKVTLTLSEKDSPWQKLKRWARINLISAYWPKPGEAVSNKTVMIAVFIAFNLAMLVVFFVTWILGMYFVATPLKELSLNGLFFYFKDFLGCFL